VWTPLRVIFDAWKNFFDVNQVVCELIISPTIVSYQSKVCELPSLLLCFCQKLEEKTK
jgi:hypothetical protein